MFISHITFRHTAAMPFQLLAEAFPLPLLNSVCLTLVSARNTEAENLKSTFSKFIVNWVCGLVFTKQSRRLGKWMRCGGFFFLQLLLVPANVSAGEKTPAREHCAESSVFIDSVGRKVCHPRKQEGQHACRTALGADFYSVPIQLTLRFLKGRFSECHLPGFI